MDDTRVSKQIFEVARIVPVLPDIWLVEGRAYEDISVGDSVAIEIVDSPGVNELLIFKVVAASTYGYLLPGLDRGLTGGLTIVAQAEKKKLIAYQKQLREAKVLVDFQS